MPNPIVTPEEVGREAVRTWEKLKIYDISINEMREATQADIDKMEAAIGYLFKRISLIGTITNPSFEHPEWRGMSFDERDKRMRMAADIIRHGNPKKLAEDFPL